LSLEFNAAWGSRILGALAPLARAGAWDGTESEQYAAAQAIEQLLQQLEN